MAGCSRFFKEKRPTLVTCVIDPPGSGLYNYIMHVSQGSPWLLLRCPSLGPGGVRMCTRPRCMLMGCPHRRSRTMSSRRKAAPSQKARRPPSPLPPQTPLFLEALNAGGGQVLALCASPTTSSKPKSTLPSGARMRCAHYTGGSVSVPVWLSL
jgi:hypothetical protein